ncbi:hypothetical protein CP985_05635 [Malaciobacter mytili LMG 24559]|uniref:Uncharacterized protein n=1 Tax=Malaciobacter mytili LMG 24559 TaxID=1032238 RepID=A0AAX2AHD8_9BACT|nr:hypothetical protein [Malaciobacter mytili]AXH14369.1 hypothetical protein AMYT_0776 [Malaciobacter mytili LMG 24559]RXK16055.1 hypothetical protein CP985_05635 [Malaciobacter mytili LMG 24559]
MEKLPFYAPKQWWENRDKAIKEDCNGCGSELDLSGKLVPNTLYGLDISKECCCPHDWGYKYGKTWLDKMFTDVMFLYNMTAKIINTGGWLVIPRLLRATKYFIAVVKYGDKSFADGKEFISREKEITFKGEFR